MKMSPSSLSVATKERRPSALSSRNSPASPTRPSTSEGWPEIMLNSPVNDPGVCVVMVRSASRFGCTISKLPESSTKNGTGASPGLNRISPARTRRSFATRRTRSICSGVRAGNI